jgi:hypothetical protein
MGWRFPRHLKTSIHTDLKRRRRMADGRMLKKKISLNQELADLKNDTHRLLFTWALAHADVEGRLSGEARVFKATVCPLLEDIKTSQIDEFFKDAQAIGLIEYYEVDGKHWMAFPGFAANQKLRRDKEAESRIPPPKPPTKPKPPGKPRPRKGSGQTPQGVGESPTQAHTGPQNEPKRPKTDPNPQDPEIEAELDRSRITPGELPEEARTTPGEVPLKLSEVKLKKAIYARNSNNHFGESPIASDEALFQEILLAAQDPILQTIQFNAHQFIQKYKGKHPRAILHAIDQVRRAAHKGIPVKPWPYAEKIIRIESKNFREADAIQAHKRLMEELKKMYPREAVERDE